MIWSTIIAIFVLLLFIGYLHGSRLNALSHIQTQNFAALAKSFVDSHDKLSERLEEVETEIKTLKARLPPPYDSYRPWVTKQEIEDWSRAKEREPESISSGSLRGLQRR